jgi:hypothetical protein
MRMVPQAVKRSSKFLIVLAGCATLLSVSFPATALASGDSCSPQIIGGQECTAIVGSGLKITSISGTYRNNGPTEEYDILIDFYGPNGNITSTATYNVPAYGSIGPFVWHNPTPTVNRPAGDYCTQGGGHSDCVDVHS